MTLDVTCPKCGHPMEPHGERTVHHETIIELSCPNCLHREIAVVCAGAGEHASDTKPVLD